MQGRINLRAVVYGAGYTIAVIVAHQISGNGGLATGLLLVLLTYVIGGSLPETK